MKYDLSKMLYYHGEKECPYAKGVGNKPYWWTYERVFVENCEEKGLSQKRLDRQYPKHIIEMLKHVADKYGCSHWTGYLEGYLNGHAILTKYDLSGMRYYHGETKCPYEANFRESVRWGDEMEYVADCEAKGFSQEGLSSAYFLKRRVEQNVRRT